MPLRKAAEGKASHPHVRLGSDPSASPPLTRSGSWHSRTIECCEATCSARKVKKPKHPLPTEITALAVFLVLLSTWFSPILTRKFRHRCGGSKTYGVEEITFQRI